MVMCQMETVFTSETGACCSATKEAGGIDNNNENTSGAGGGDAAGFGLPMSAALVITEENGGAADGAVQQAEPMRRKYQARHQANIKREQDPREPRRARGRGTRRVPGATSRSALADRC
jgi:hypothetical protein